MKNIPSDSHIRFMLDSVPPSRVGTIYRLIFERLEAGGILDGFRSYAKSLLIALDGTEYSPPFPLFIEKIRQSTKLCHNGEQQPFIHSVR